MFQDIKNIGEFYLWVKGETPVLAYFSTNGCNVCKVLKPKVAQLINESFPKIKLIYINLSEIPNVGAQLRVFSVPTIIIYFEGKEFIRKSRNVGISELKGEIGRLYSILFPGNS